MYFVLTSNTMITNTRKGVFCGTGDGKNRLWVTIVDLERLLSFFLDLAFTQHFVRKRDIVNCVNTTKESCRTISSTKHTYVRTQYDPTSGPNRQYQEHPRFDSFDSIQSRSINFTRLQSCMCAIRFIRLDSDIRFIRLKS